MSTAEQAVEPGGGKRDKAAWAALGAVAIGFFTILVDTTIVSTAMPAIRRGVDTGISGVAWVNGAHLLAFAVPLLITGRLGDRYGQKTCIWPGLRFSPPPPCGAGCPPSSGC